MIQRSVAFFISDFVLFPDGALNIWESHCTENFESQSKKVELINDKIHEAKHRSFHLTHVLLKRTLIFGQIH